jgi:hypothetical protein
VGEIRRQDTYPYLRRIIEIAVALTSACSDHNKTVHSELYSTATGQI